MAQMIGKPEIIQQLKNRSDRPMALEELMKELAVPAVERHQFKRLVLDLVREGTLVETRGSRYGLPQKMDLVVGTLKGHPDGYGFVLPEEPGASDLFVGARNMEGAMHGDRVVARVESTRPDGRREGRIIRILKRGRTRVVGRFEPGRKFSYLLPSDRRLARDILITAEHTGGAVAGDIVVARLVEYPTGTRNPEGTIERVIGRIDDPRVDTEIVIEQMGLFRDFSADVLAEARRLPERLDPHMVDLELKRGRVDLRGQPTVTIDGEKARDFDDAVFVASVPEGFRLFVHIADVSHYVPPGSALDREGYLRGTSVYFPDAVLPMFPERLSNGICSLNPREDRLAATVEIVFDRKGRRLSYKIYESVIKSRERMTYGAVAASLKEERPHPLAGQFREMERLCAILREVRRERGSLDFDLPEPEIILDLTSGATLSIIKEERNVAHRIIEEFMLAANQTVAEHLTQARLPTLYRIHEDPSPEKMTDFVEFIKGFGLNLSLPAARESDGGLPVPPKALARLIEKVRDTPYERLINHLLLRSLKQARYSEQNLGHFGLASDCYTHFTSPIRRYPDLVVHRLLKDLLKRKAIAPLPLAEIARHTSERERIAMEAERESVQRRKVKFMTERVGEVHSAFITGVAPYGFFVELADLFVEGLVPLSSLSDDYYFYEEREHALIGRKSRRMYRVGDPVEVRVESVDVERMQVNFALVRPTTRLRTRPIGSDLLRRKPAGGRGRRSRGRR